MTGFGADGSVSLGESTGNAVGSGPSRWSPPGWKLGTWPIGDRGGM